jgi:hypothetical protein
LNNQNFWGIHDKFEGSELKSIFPISERIYSLIYRELSNLEIGAINLIGAIKMVEGLEYHYDKYLQNKASLQRFDIHDLTAYMNLMGQLFAFFKSSFVIKNVPEINVLITKIIYLKPFRDKSTAHRSIDFPRNESNQAKIKQALPFFFFKKNR